MCFSALGSRKNQLKFMNPEEPKVQKVVIDMGHAWTPEERKQKEDREKNEKGEDGPKEQKEYPKKFSSAREYINNKISEFKNRDDKVEIGQDWESVEGDLDCGNERGAMERLEYMASTEHSKTKKDPVLWRKAIFEISKEIDGSARFMDTDAVGKSFYDEFTKLQDEMNNTLDKNPGDFSEKDRKDNDKWVLRWYDASNELLTNGHSENALILLEQEIEDRVSDDHRLRGEIEQVAKSKTASIEYINRTKETINANFKKLAIYRRMRDSLLAIEFSK